MSTDTVEALEQELAEVAEFATQLSQVYAWLEDQLEPALMRERDLKDEIQASRHDGGSKAQRRELYGALDVLTARYGRRRQALAALKRELKAAGHTYRAVTKLLERARAKATKASARAGDDD